MICSKCGATAPDNSRFCTQCGTTFQTTPAPPPDAGKKKNKLLIPIISCAGVIVLLFAALLIFTDIFKGGGNANTGESPSPSQDLSVQAPPVTESAAPSESQSIAPSTGQSSAPSTPPSSPSVSSPSPSITPPAPKGDYQMSRGGGSVEVSGETTYDFSPDKSGRWEFGTWYLGGSDPHLWLYDSNGVVIGEHYGGGADMSAYMFANLDADATYLIKAGFDKYDGEYRLVASFGEGSSGYYAPTSGTLLEDDGRFVIDSSTFIFVDGASVYEFTPDISGGLMVFTSDNVDCDPYLQLYDSRGVTIAFDDDGIGDENALIFYELSAGETYLLRAGIYAMGEGRFTLVFMPITVIPDSGGDLPVSADTMFVFTPDKSITWTFKTLDCGDRDPFLEFYYEGELFVSDDDFGGGYNAMMGLDLTAGVTYFINSAFYDSEEGGCTLRVEPAPVLSGDGGEIQVDNSEVVILTPDQSGAWELLASDSGGFTPYIYIFDDNGGYVGMVDSADDGPDAFLSVELTAGVEYCIHVSFYEDGASCTFSARNNSQATQ